MTHAFDGLPLLHTRNYETQVYLDGDHLKVVGSVRDIKPPGVYIDNDPEPLEVHHMAVVLTVAASNLMITDAIVEFRTHPNQACPSIIGHYNKLVGLSIARGFNAKVRELFGGPKACTHTTALLQAMAPVAIQAMWSMRMHQHAAQGKDPFEPDPDAPPHYEINLNTCHVWAEGSDLIERARAGEQMEVPIWIQRRFAELGRSTDDWGNPR